jgi:excisionase family DNA binding protein
MSATRLAAAVVRATPYDDLPDMLTVDEFGSWLGISRNTAYELVRRGDVPHMRFGRLIRIPKTAIAATPRPDIG